MWAGFPTACKLSHLSFRDVFVTWLGMRHLCNPKPGCGVGYFSTRWVCFGQFKEMWMCPSTRQEKGIPRYAGVRDERLGVLMGQRWANCRSTAERSQNELFHTFRALICVRSCVWATGAYRNTYSTQKFIFFLGRIKCALLKVGFVSIHVFLRKNQIK